MEQIRQLSLKKTIMLYLLVALTVSFFMSAFIIFVAQRIQNNVWYHYIDIDKYSDLIDRNEQEYGVWIQVRRPSGYVMSKADHSISEICDFVITWSPLILSTLFSGMAVILFYRNKLKEPLRILEEGSNEIADNNLDFQIKYEVKDEMGRLCSSFENMRNQLQINNSDMWKMVEEQKELKAAIAHDLRAPLAILKGYHEMLLEYIPQDKINKEKLNEIILSCDKQTDRLSSFLETMRQLSSLEERNIACEEVNTDDFVSQLETTADILARHKDIEIKVFTEPQVPAVFQADRAAILEVYENLLSNALRYAANKIKIFVGFNSGLIQITVWDDGKGFKAGSMDMVTKAYYHDNAVNDSGHFGLGLYISRLLCEKHRGRLVIENSEYIGAKVRAEFQIRQLPVGAAK